MSQCQTIIFVGLDEFLILVIVRNWCRSNPYFPQTFAGQAHSLACIF